MHNGLDGVVESKDNRISLTIPQPLVCTGLSENTYSIHHSEKLMESQGSSTLSIVRYSKILSQVK
jgi:hypothetical protein